jgi:hypothetical protein
VSRSPDGSARGRQQRYKLSVLETKLISQSANVKIGFGICIVKTLVKSNLSAA